jgi:hypothetical protein
MENPIEEGDYEKLIVPSYRSNEHDLRYIKEMIVRKSKTNNLPGENYSERNVSSKKYLS